MRPFYRKDLFRDEIVKIMPKELTVKYEQEDKKLSILKMEKGQSYSFYSEDYEVALVILSGMATVRADGFEAAEKGSRKDPFSGQPAVIYIPKETEYTVTAVGYGILEVALCMAKTSTASEPFVIEPEEIVREKKGMLNWSREIHELLTPENAKKACSLEVGEIYGCPGTWATYPYTQEDKETVYFFRFSPNPGKKLQVMESQENALAYKIGSDTVVTSTGGYLPVTNPEECQVYCLWFKVR